MAVTKRSAILFSVSTVQRVIDLALIASLLGFLILFGLQFPHSPNFDELWLITHVRQWGNPVLGGCAPWFNASWPTSSTSVLPLGAAFATWIVKILVDMPFLRLHRKLSKVLAPPREAGVEELGIAGLDQAGISADSEQAREQLLKRYREIEDALKASKRKNCTFLSIDIVGSTHMKVGESETAIAATFQAYEEMVKKIFEQYGAWKQAWTPDGVMVCFLQADLAVGAAQRLLLSLKKFNEKDNKLKTPFRVRCGLNEGQVPIFEDSKLEKVADRIIDVAGHMQKQGNPDTLWLSAQVFGRLTEKSVFRPTGKEVDGFAVYEWAVESGETTAAAAASSP